MDMQPSLETPRLILRAFRLEDAPDLQRLAGAREVAATTLTMPHPYEKGMAEGFIESMAFSRANGVTTFAVTLRDTGELVGCMSIGVQEKFRRGELGYWVGVPYWGRGYATEAARAIVRFGFETLKLNRIYASHFASNPASGRVMEKVGMKYEGLLRQHYCRWGEWQDAVFRGILASDWEEEGRVESTGSLSTSHQSPD